MSKFLNELRRYVNASVQAGIYKDEYDVNSECKDEALNMIDSLGENARRMLEIGILQDKLVKLGFKLNNCELELEAGGFIDSYTFISNKSYNYYDDNTDRTIDTKFYILFSGSMYYISYYDDYKDVFRYLDTCSSGDLLTYVKGLIK